MSSLKRKIAVISDIHIGPSARSKDLCPGIRSERLPNEQFSETFEEFLAGSPEIRADHLIVSGDISSKAVADEFLLASTLVKRWATALGVAADEIYFVPGNHDVDWSVLDRKGDEGNEQIRWKQRYDGFIRTDQIFGERMQSAGSTFFEEPYAAIWATPQLVVAALNSAAHDRPNQTPHHGFADPISIKWLDKELASYPVEEGQLRIFVVHHHPLQFSEPFPRIPEFRDFSTLANTSDLQLLMRKHNFDLLIHGHKHVPRFETIVIASDFPIPVLGAGSFCVDMGSSYSGSFANQFHILEVEGRAEGAIFGILHNWAFTGPNGWRPSTDYTGIDQRVGFGHFFSKSDVTKTIRGLVKSRVGAGFPITWGQLLLDDPRLRYIQPRTQMEALRTVASDEHLDIAGTPPGDVVLYKA